MNSATTTGGEVVITVELFGMARVHAGVSSIAFPADAQAPVAELLQILARRCPDLVETALFVADDGTISLADGYALNRNGLVFLPPSADEPMLWTSGDSLLLLSNQAGG